MLFSFQLKTKILFYFRANREEMLAKSAQQQQTTSNNVPRNISTAPTSVLVQNEELPMPTTVPTTKPGFNNQVLY